MRLVAFVLVAACSSKAKPTDESSTPAGSTAVPAPTATAPAAQGSGSAQDAWAPKPVDPAAELALLREDIDMICGAAKVTGKKYFNEVGPYIAEHMKTDFLGEQFRNIRSGAVTLEDIVARIREGMAKVNVTKCETVDVLVKNRPKPQP